MAVLLLARDPQLLDRQDSSGQTALHYAASCGHREMVQLLISRWVVGKKNYFCHLILPNFRGADCSIVDEDGVTACNGDTEQEIKKLFV